MYIDVLDYFIVIFLYLLIIKTLIIILIFIRQTVI